MLKFIKEDSEEYIAKYKTRVNISGHLVLVINRIGVLTISPSGYLMRVPGCGGSGMTVDSDGLIQEAKYTER